MMLNDAGEGDAEKVKQPTQHLNILLQTIYELLPSYKQHFRGFIFILSKKRILPY